MQRLTPARHAARFSSLRLKRKRPSASCFLRSFSVWRRSTIAMVIPARCQNQTARPRGTCLARSKPKSRTLIALARDRFSCSRFAVRRSARSSTPPTYVFSACCGRNSHGHAGPCGFKRGTIGSGQFPGVHCRANPRPGHDARRARATGPWLQCRHMWHRRAITASPPGACCGFFRWLPALQFGKTAAGLGRSPASYKRRRLREVRAQVRDSRGQLVV